MSDIINSPCEITSKEKIEKKNFFVFEGHF